MVFLSFLCLFGLQRSVHPEYVLVLTSTYIYSVNIGNKFQINLFGWHNILRNSCTGSKQGQQEINKLQCECKLGQCQLRSCIACSQWFWIHTFIKASTNSLEKVLCTCIHDLNFYRFVIKAYIWKSTLQLVMCFRINRKNQSHVVLVEHLKTTLKP